MSKCIEIESAGYSLLIGCEYDYWPDEDDVSYDNFFFQFETDKEVHILTAVFEKLGIFDLLIDKYIDEIRELYQKK